MFKKNCLFACLFITLAFISQCALAQSLGNSVLVNSQEPVEPIPADDTCIGSPIPYKIKFVPYPPYVIFEIIPLPEGFDCVPTLPPGDVFVDESTGIIWIQPK